MFASTAKLYYPYNVGGNMNSIKARLLSAADKKYQKFSAGLIPNADNILGIRIPVLRKIAKEIYKTANCEDFINSDSTEFMEETMLQGMLIGLSKDKPEKILENVKNFVPKIDNWAVCDIFCGGLKFTKNNKEQVWNFLQPYLKSDKEYEIRFGVVMILSYFIEEDYLDEILRLLENIRHEGYYVKMGVAWAVSICYIKFPAKTHKFLENCKLQDWTYNKSIQKIIESYRVDSTTKEILKKMKRR